MAKEKNDFSVNKNKFLDDYQQKKINLENYRQNLENMKQNLEI